MTGSVLVLTGPPGAGKTTVAALLADRAAVPTVHLETDLFYRAIRTGFVLPFLPAADQQNRVVVAAIVAAVTAFARGGYDVVVDGVVGPWFLPGFRAAAAAEDLALSYVVLRPDLGTTLSRATGRAAGELRDEDVIRGLHEAFGELGDLERHALDTAGLGPEETAERVRRWVAAGSCRLG